MLTHSASLVFLIALLLVGTVIAALAVAWHRKVRRVRAHEEAAREIEHVLVQNAQALILQVHGALKDLDEHDVTRRRIEGILDSADEQLSEVRDRVQDLRMHCDPREP